jgi:GxxExxY protein
MSNLIYPELSYTIVGLAYAVHKALGPGLLESCYEGAMVVELQRAAIPFQRQQVFPVNYKGEYIGAYIADLVVDGKIILELKSVKALNAEMKAQLINYLKLSQIPVGYLFNFHGIRLEKERLVC